MSSINSPSKGIALKALLIRPYMYFPKVAREYFTILPPIGLGYIASVLERAGHEVRILDAFGLGWEKNSECNDRELIRVGISKDEIAAELRKFSPDMVGISNPFSSQAMGMRETAELVKRIDPKIKVLIGGVHPSSVPLECMKDPNIDFLVKGEGEMPVLELISHIKGELPIEKVMGVYYRNGTEICFNGAGSVFKDLDEIPLPAYHLMPMNEYFEAAKKDMTTRGGLHDRWTHLVTSRGCPYSCNFCSAHLMEGKKWRRRSAKNIADEIEMLHKKYEVKRITFEDSNFTLDIKRAEEVCDEIIKRGFNIKWSLPNGLRADRLTDNLLMKMKEAGCIEITLAVEHGDQEFLSNVIKKNLDLKKVEKIVVDIRRAGIPVSGFFIVGIPPEDKTTVQKTIDMVKKLARLGMVPQVNVAMPLPGTEMYDDCLKKGYIPQGLTEKDYLLMGHSKPVIKTEFFSPDDLLALRRKIYFTGLVNLSFFHPLLFLKLPFVRATIKDIINPKTVLLRIRKIAGIFFPERLRV